MKDPSCTPHEGITHIKVLMTAKLPNNFPASSLPLGISDNVRLSIAGAHPVPNKDSIVTIVKVFSSNAKHVMTKEMTIMMSDQVAAQRSNAALH